MSPVDLLKLKAAAQAATPGPWQYDGWGYVWDDTMTMVSDNTLDADGQVTRIRGYSAEESANATREPGQMDKNAEYIAAANPRAVLELIEEVERLRTMNRNNKAAPAAEGDANV